MHHVNGKHHAANDDRDLPDACDRSALVAEISAPKPMVLLLVVLSGIGLVTVGALFFAGAMWVVHRLGIL